MGRAIQGLVLWVVRSESDAYTVCWWRDRKEVRGNVRSGSGKHDDSDARWMVLCQGESGLYAGVLEGFVFAER